MPLFVTQLLGAFNDNLYKNAMLLFVVYSIYNSEGEETRFSAIASGMFILPFFLLSALAGQLADMRDKAKLIRIIKACEVGIMLVGGGGLVLAWHDMAVQTLAIPLMLTALLAMGVHSSFFGPIKYAILPQHLHADEVLAGTGLVEAGTYIAILAGTILAGFLPVQWAAVAVVATALVGFVSAQAVPPAPPVHADQPIDYNIFRSSFRLIQMTMRHPRVFLAIAAISLFWAVGAVLFIQFPPLAKNVLGASKSVASLFLVIFSIGIAIGSVSINQLLKGKVSARYSTVSVIVMAAFIVAFDLVCRDWPPHGRDNLFDIMNFLAQPLAVPLLLTLLGIAVAGGMFVVPLYAFLTTVVDKAETSRTIAANNIVNSGSMVIGSLIAVGLSAANVAIVHQLLLGAAMCSGSAWLGWLLYRAEQAHLGEIEHTFGVTRHHQEREQRQRHGPIGEQEITHIGAGDHFPVHIGRPQRVARHGFLDFGLEPRHRRIKPRAHPLGQLTAKGVALGRLAGNGDRAVHISPVNRFLTRFASLPGRQFGAVPERHKKGRRRAAPPFLLGPTQVVQANFKPLTWRTPLSLRALARTSSLTGLSTDTSRSRRRRPRRGRGGRWRC